MKDDDDTDGWLRLDSPHLPDLYQLTGPALCRALAVRYMFEREVAAFDRDRVPEHEPS